MKDSETGNRNERPPPSLTMTGLGDILSSYEREYYIAVTAVIMP